MTTCKSCLDLLVDYLEGELPEEERKALDQHFAYCPPCQEFFRTYRETPRIVRKATVCHMPSSVKQRLQEFLSKKKSE